MDENANARYWTRQRIIMWSVAVLALGYFFISGRRNILPNRMSPALAQRYLRPARWDGTYPCVYADSAGATTAPHIGRCSTPTSHKGPVDRFEADLRYGSFVLRRTDLEINDVFDVPLTRSYFSGNWPSALTPYAFGWKSTQPYDIGPVGTRNPYTLMSLTLEDGDYLCFPRVSEGTGYEDAVFLHSDTSTRFYGAVIYWNVWGWTLKLRDGSRMEFPEAYNAHTLADGAATKIVDPEGNTLKLNRNLHRVLQEIRTPHAHWMRFEHDERAQITEAKDDRGNTVKYGYNGDGMLTSAVSSFGQERHYEYQGFLMTVVRGGSGQILLRNTYKNNILIAQQFANGEVFQYAYEWNTNRTYANQVIVTLPNGSTQNIPIGDAVPEDILQRP